MYLELSLFRICFASRFRLKIRKADSESLMDWLLQPEMGNQES
jgi:hypothetical protein